MRAVFYSGLLALALTQASPITLASPLAGSDPALHIPVDFVRWSGLGSIDGSTIIHLRNLCLAAWICAAAGLFTGPAKLATALTLLPLHALSIGIHNSHGWYVPAYTLLFLCFARSDRDFSLDALIRQKWPGWMGGNLRHTIGSSGLPRKLVLLVAVHTLFAGGVSKLREGGWQWIDGHTMQSYISLTWECIGTSPRFPLLADAILHSQTLAVLCSAAALLFELASPAALFSRKARAAVVIGALGFHAMIFFVMAPRFIEQSWCYILLVDWRTPARFAHRFLPARLLRKTNADCLAAAPTLEQSRPAWIASLAATLLAGVFLASALRGWESWPLTCVPMYSSYVGNGRVSHVASRDFDSVDGLKSLAQSGPDNIPWAWRMVIWPRLDLEFVGPEGGSSIKNTLPGAGGLKFYSWFFILTDLAMQEIPGNRMQGLRHLDAARILQIIKKHAASKISFRPNQPLRLMYRFPDGTQPLVLAETD
jgi:hypothetical protein